jgi:hypothetical protein
VFVIKMLRSRRDYGDLTSEIGAPLVGPPHAGSVYSARLLERSKAGIQVDKIAP